MSTGGIECLILAMRNHKQVAELQSVLCNCLANIAGLDVSYSDKIAAAGGIQSIVSAMKIHKDRLDLLAHACTALNDLSLNESNQAKIRAAGGIDAIITAIHNMLQKLEHQIPPNFKLLYSGSRALASLCTDSANRTKFAGAGGIDCILSAMKHFKGEIKMQVWGCIIMEKLAAGSTELSEKVAAAGGILAVVAAMCNMEEDEDQHLIQLSACNALKALANVAANQEQIEHAGTQFTCFTGTRVQILTLRTRI